MSSDMTKKDLTIKVDDLKLHYLTRFGTKVDAVRGVSFELERGKVIGLAGESGCGKSTLVNGMMGLFLPPLYHGSGKVIIGGEDITQIDKEKLRVEYLGKKISIIPQGALNSLNPTRRIRKFAADVMKEHEPTLTKAEIEVRLVERFKAIGLDPLVLDKYPCQLSGGMKQRVVIGISTLMNPDVVIADEPTSALDVSTQKAVIEMLMDLMDKGIFGSMIFITHELPLLYHVADDIAVMYQGEVVEIGTSEQIINNPQHEYSKMLMAEARKLDAHGERYGE